MRTERKTLTAEEAASFDHFSVQNAVSAEQACNARPGCTCKAYESIYTYNRWKALGRQVRRGEHGTKISVLVKTEDKDTGKTRSFPRTSTVFCKCQTDEATSYVSAATAFALGFLMVTQLAACANSCGRLDHGEGMETVEEINCVTDCADPDLSFTDTCCEICGTCDTTPNDQEEGN